MWINVLQKTDSNRQARKLKKKKNEVSKCNLAFYTLSSKTVISGEKKKIKRKERRKNKVWEGRKNERKARRKKEK